MDEVRSKDALLSDAYSGSHALVVGIDEYESAGTLEYAVNDAQAVATLLADSFHFESGNITVLANKDATRQRVLSEFLRLTDRRLVSPNDRVLFFFAGHGHTVTGRSAQSGFLVPVDGTTEDIASLIRWDELTSDSDLIPAKHLFFILDACFSGLALPRSIGPGTSRFLSDMLSRYSRQVLTAGKADETVSDSGGPKAGHSVFTGHLLEGLEGQAQTNDGVLTANSLMSHVYHSVSRDSGSRQTPHYGYIQGDGDFVFDDGVLKHAANGNEEEPEQIMITLPAPDAELHETQKSLIDEIKRYLSDPQSTIQLHDLVVQSARAYMAAISARVPDLNQEQIDADSVAERLGFYENAVADAQAIAACIGYWGLASHRAIFRKLLTHIAEPIEQVGGLVVWLSMRWIPIIIMTYAAGVAAVASQNYSILADLLLTEVWSDTGSSPRKPVAVAFLEAFGRLAALLRKLPAHEKHKVPTSEFLFTKLQPSTDDLFFLGRDYEPTFDKFEVLLSLVQVDLALQDVGRPFFSTGRYSYKRIDPGRSPHLRVFQEAEVLGPAWGPIRAGLFGGDVERFATAKKAFQESLNQMPML